MSAAAKRKVTPEEYLTIERRAEFRSEYHLGEVIPRSRASFAHTLIKDNIAFELANRMEGGDFHILTSDLRVRTDDSKLYAYPDLVACMAPLFEDESCDTLLNPTVIVEVVSDATAEFDRGAKSERYRETPSLVEYYLVSQDKPLVERFVRQPEGSWLLTSFAGLVAEMASQSLSVRIPLADVYAGVTLPSTGSPATPP